MHIQMRVFAAWIFAFAAFILSLLVLTAGSKPGFLEGAAIATVFLECFFTPVEYKGDRNSDWPGLQLLSVGITPLPHVV